MIIGLTGGIGSGKSTAANYLKEKGYRVIDSDAIAREIVAPGSECLARIKETFGEDVIAKDGSLDRAALAAKVFNDKEEKARLDEIMFKAIMDAMFAEIERGKAAGEDLIFADVPLLYESGFDRYTDMDWLVSAPEEERIRRVMRRDGVSEEEVKRRIQSQMPEAEKRKRADRVLENDGSEEDLGGQIDALLAEIGK